MIVNYCVPCCYERYGERNSIKNWIKSKIDKDRLIATKCFKCEMPAMCIKVDDHLARRKQPIVSRSG